MAFLMMSVVVLNAVWLWMPKRLTYTEMYLSIFFVTCLEMVFNIILDLKYDLYGYFKKGVDLETFIAIFGLYPALAVIYANFFPKGMRQRVLYLLAWSVFAVAYEWAAVKSGYFYYKEWKLWYSALLYPPLYLSLNGNLYLYRRLNRAQRNG